MRPSITEAIAQALREIGKPLDPEQVQAAARARGLTLPVEGVHVRRPGTITHALEFHVPTHRHGELAAIVDQLQK